jgi:hypothetical protein
MPEKLPLDDLALVRQASSPELLRDFGRWQDLCGDGTHWRRIDAHEMSLTYNYLFHNGFDCARRDPIDNRSQC